jgi:cleavage and polyadenylation specificity factor subunit 2
MGESIVQAFQSKDQPFDFRNIKCFTSIKDVEALSGNKVVIASFPELEYGFSNQIMLEWASDPQSCILFPEIPQKNTLGGTLFSYWDESKTAAPVSLKIDIPFTVRK